MKRYIGGISYKTSAHPEELEPTTVTGEYPRSPQVEYSLTERGKSLIPILDNLCQWGTTTASDPPVPGRFFEHLFDFLSGVWYNTPD